MERYTPHSTQSPTLVANLRSPPILLPSFYPDKIKMLPIVYSSGQRLCSASCSLVSLALHYRLNASNVSDPGFTVLPLISSHHIASLYQDYFYCSSSFLLDLRPNNRNFIFSFSTAGHPSFLNWQGWRHRHGFVGRGTISRAQLAKSFFGPSPFAYLGNMKQNIVQFLLL